MDRPRSTVVGALWLAVGFAAAVTLFAFDWQADPLGTATAAVTAVGSCLVGLSFLLGRPRAWWE